MTTRVSRPEVFILRTSSPTVDAEEVPIDPKEPVYGPAWTSYKSLRIETRLQPDQQLTTKGDTPE